MQTISVQNLCNRCHQKAKKVCGSHRVQHVRCAQTKGRFAARMRKWHISCVSLLLMQGETHLKRFPNFTYLKLHYFKCGVDDHYHRLLINLYKNTKWVLILSLNSLNCWNMTRDRFTCNLCLSGYFGCHQKLWSRDITMAAMVGQETAKC